MIVYIVIITLAIIVALIMYKKTETFCNCAGFGTRKVSKPAYYNYSQNDVSRYGARDVRWPVGTPYDAYSMQYNAAMRKNAAQYAANNCNVKFVEM